MAKPADPGPILPMIPVYGNPNTPGQFRYLGYEYQTMPQNPQIYALVQQRITAEMVNMSETHNLPEDIRRLVDLAITITTMSQEMRDINTFHY